MIEVAAGHGLAPIAASSHPFSLSARQKRTDKERYVALLEEMQGVARRMMICGLHVHVGIDDNELRIDLMNQLTYFLPHMLALSCSSPFWEGERTGLKSFRLLIFNGVPRTGLPEPFASWSEVPSPHRDADRHGDHRRSSRIWWDLRPSARYPTLETRVMDCCTTLEDSVRLATLNQCLVRMLYRLRHGNQRWRSYPALLVGEEPLACDALLVRRRITGSGTTEDRAVRRAARRAARDAASDAGARLRRRDRGLREILKRGTERAPSARDLRGPRCATTRPSKALRAVTRWLIEETACF